VSKRLDIDAASGDVCCNKYSVLPALESSERFSALSLRTVSMNSLGLDSVPDEILRQTIRAMLRAREDECFLHVAAIEQLEEER
jgi:hypothetical protein